MSDTTTAWLAEKIERLEAELAVWQRHGVKVTEDCETCGGSETVSPMYRGRNGWRPDNPCPDCGGTGKKPRDGAERIEDNFCDIAKATRPRRIE